MHIFKNVGQIVWEHLIGDWDNKKSWSDLQEGDIVHVHAYWPVIGEGGVKNIAKSTLHTVKIETNKGKKDNCKFLHANRAYALS